MEPILDDDGEVTELIEEPEAEEPMPLPNLPMLRLIKRKDGTIEILSAARTPKEVMTLFDHCLIRLREEFNNKSKPIKKLKQDYVG